MAKSKSLLVGWGGCLLDKTEAFCESSRMSIRSIIMVF